MTKTTTKGERKKEPGSTRWNRKGEGKPMEVIERPDLLTKRTKMSKKAPAYK